MTDKPTGVFVRLPLSGEQIKAADAIAKEISENNTENEWRFARHHASACDELILAIGMPVAGGELEAVDYSDYEPEYHYQGMGCGLEDRGITDRYDAMGYGWDQALERVFSELPETVLLSAAQAALAAAQAEIAEEQRISNLRAEAIERWSNSCAQQDEIIAGLQAENMRLREHLETVRSYLKEAPSVTARRGALDVIEEALKGPAA